MLNTDGSQINIGELIRSGVALHTQDVVALVHEACRQAGVTLAQGPDDLWISDTGQLFVTPPDHPRRDDARAAIANLLETMLPQGGDDGERMVPASLRGLPARLRASTGVGPREREDLMAILAWHLDADPPEQIQRLARRVRDPIDTAPAGAPAPGDEFELFTEAVADTPAPAPAPATPPPAPATPASPPPLERRTPPSTILAALALAFLFIGIGAGSYWLLRQPGAGAPEASIAEPPAPGATPVAPAPSSTAAPNQPATASAASQPVAERRPAPLQLDVAEGAFSPAFATDGRQLFFHAGRSNAGRILVASLDADGQVSRVSAVLDENARNYHPRVSPDGRLMAFDSDRDGERGVYVAERDGSNPQRVSGNGYAAVPSWSPDMKWLAFVRGERTRPRVWNLWLRDLASGTVQRHTSFRAGQVWGASWFPDGRSLCYSHEDQLVISHLDSRDDIIIDSPRPGLLVRTPAVSPDGQHVVFQVYKDGVWLLDVRTRAMRRILDDPAAEEFSWTPDGRRIAYHSRRDGAWKIWMMPAPRSI